MKQLEAITILAIVFTITLPFYAVFCAIAFIVEIGFTLSDMLTGEDMYEKGVVAKYLRNYFNMLGNLYQQFVGGNK